MRPRNKGAQVCVCVYIICRLGSIWDEVRNSARKMDLWCTVQVGEVQAAVAYISQYETLYYRLQ